MDYSSCYVKYTVIVGQSKVELAFEKPLSINGMNKRKAIITVKVKIINASLYRYCILDIGTHYTGIKFSRVKQYVGKDS